MKVLDKAILKEKVENLKLYQHSCGTLNLEQLNVLVSDIVDVTLYMLKELNTLLESV